MVDPGVHDGVGWKAGVDGLVARRRHNAGLGAAWRGLIAAGVVEANAPRPPFAIRDWGAAGGSLRADLRASLQINRLEGLFPVHDALAVLRGDLVHTRPEVRDEVVNYNPRAVAGGLSHSLR